jgi:hypothetical protein
VRSVASASAGRGTWRMDFVLQRSRAAARQQRGHLQLLLVLRRLAVLLRRTRWLAGGSWGP